ncbi:glutamate receptor 2-like [Apostichopus japonicus]|uniref:glutamate receptor 2-like n=1 Tax=Stichopus japonicus TaxID=307972 RepID=UPI003AB513AE
MVETGRFKMAPKLHYICLCFMSLCLCSVAQIPTQVRIAGFYSEMGSQAGEAFVRGGIWHNVANNITFQFIAYKQRVNVPNSFAIGMSICRSFSDRITLLTGETSLESINSVFSLANAHLTTFVTTSHSKEEAGVLRNDLRDDYFVSMRPSLTKALVDLLKHFQWSKFAYIYQDMNGIQRFYALTKMPEFKHRRYDVVLKRVSTSEEILETMSELRKTSTTRMIIDVDIEGINSILEQLQQLGMVTYQYHYIVTNLDLVKVNFSEFKVGGMNLTGFNIIDHKHTRYENFTKYWNKERQKQNKTAEMMDTEAALVFDTLAIFNETILGLGNLITLLRLRNTRQCNQIYDQVDPVDDNILRALLQSQTQGITGNVQFSERGERQNYSLNIVGLSRNGIMKVGEWHSDEKRGFEWKDKWTYAKPPMAIDAENTTEFCEASSQRNCGEPDIIMYSATAGIYSTYSDINEDKVLRITTVEEQPFLMRIEGAQEKNGKEYEGYCIDLLDEIRNIFNFTYKIEVVPGNIYGNELENGTWTGMIGQLMEQKADIALAPLTITSSRELIIDFTKPFMSLGVSIMMKKPMSSKPEVFSFLQPLSSDIWMCVAFAFIGVSVVLFLVSRFSSQEWYTEVVQTNGHRCSIPRPIDDPNAMEPMGIEKRMNNFSFSNSVWFSLGALMQQGGDTTPRSLAGRIVGGVWWFFTLILISSYTANLAAFLTVERMESPINSVKELQESDIDYGILRTGATFQLFEQSEIPLYRDMFTYMQAHTENYKDSNEDGIAEVRRRNGKYAFLLESTINEYESQQKPCDTIMVPQHLDSKSYGIGISRGYEGFEVLRDQLTLAILQLREDGTLARLRKTWWFDKGKCQESAKDNASALSLSNVAGIFYILIVGLAAALLIAIIDFYWKSRKDASRDKIGLVRAMRNKVRASVTGERGFRPVPVLMESVASSGKSLPGEKKDLLKREHGQTDV